LGVEDGGKIVAVATLVKKSLPMGMNYFYCPRGPIFNYQSSITNLQEFLFSEIKKIAEKEKIVFLRIEPKEKIENCKFKIINSIDIQVKKTIMLDLSKTEEELLKEMHQKTRYNIRLAEKKGVKIAEAGVDRFEEFWDLMSQTVNRDGFRLHDKEYYKKMLEVENIKLYFGLAPCSLGEGRGEFENNILCAGIFSFFGDTATYLHGASSNKNRELMAPYLLQWELAKLSKVGGYKYYDFFGIDEKKWPGVTRFKKGFGGEEVLYPGTFDVVLDSFRYKAYGFLRKVRRLIKI
jgi:lipid II:glycine glycyltransferase (peptidoglycan interpeptide bridge formation enzyme)